MSHIEFGQIDVIDLNQHALIDCEELFADISRIRAVLRRAADVDDDQIVSWGNLTRDEVLGLAACEDDEFLHKELLLELERLVSGPGSRSITLYYPALRYGS